MLIRIEENRKNIFLIIQKNNIRNKRKLRRMNKILVTKSAVFCLRFNDFQIFSKFILCPLLSFHTNRYCTSSWNYSRLYNKDILFQLASLLCVLYNIRVKRYIWSWRLLFNDHLQSLSHHRSLDLLYQSNPLWIFKSKFQKCL